jgi:Asp-tRNA(Asn)/Glu-tRNA(Gln) amidotransferase A subunit family amidase
MVHVAAKLSRRHGLAIGATALCFALAGLGPAARSQNADDPQYTAGGDLLLPSGFQTWVFVGSNLGLSYTPDAQAREELMFTVLKVMADNKLDAIVHKTVEHQPTLIKDGISPPYSSNKGVPTWNTFLVYAASMTVPSGFTTDNLPVGITFFGRPYSEPILLKLAYAYEQATHHRTPPKTAPALP